MMDLLLSKLKLEEERQNRELEKKIFGGTGLRKKGSKQSKVSRIDRGKALAAQADEARRKGEEKYWGGMPQARCQ